MRNPIIQMALAGAAMMAAVQEHNIRKSTKTGYQRDHRYTKNDKIPKWARRYSKRYGGMIHYA